MTLAHEMSETTRKRIEYGFRYERDPYGKPWPKKKIPNGQKTLVESGDMKKKFKVVLSPGGFRFSNPQPYTNTHNYGDRSRNIPERKMWPGSKGLPALYIRDYTLVYERLTMKVVKK
jgi:phage gpG-like protein